jgi:hypothetical protein
MNRMQLASRIGVGLVGAVLLVSGAVKAWEPVLFFWEAVPYTQLLGLSSLWREVATVAVFLAPGECVLGVGLLVNWQHRWLPLVALALLVFFLALTAYAWYSGATADCGCFGSLVQRSPGEAAVEDGVLVLVLGLSWWAGRGTAAAPRAGWFVAAAAIAATAATLLGFVPQTERLDKSDLLPGVRLRGLEVNGLAVNLMQGDFLVELMNPKCGHCIDAVPTLNELVAAGDLPRLIALTSFAPDSPDVADFVREHQPGYPLGSVSRTDFFRLTWKHGFPRLALIRDGVVRQVWERDSFPKPEEVRTAMGAQP